MKKIIFFKLRAYPFIVHHSILSILLAGFLLISHISFGQYCIPAVSRCALMGTSYGHIINVTMNGSPTALNNSTAANDCGNVSNGYSDFTLTSSHPVTPPDFTPGNTYNFSVSQGNFDNFTPYYLGIWIDFNDVGDFIYNSDYDAGTNPTGQRFYNSPSGIKNGSFTGTITIPATAPLGHHRMRVRLLRGDCGNNPTAFPCGLGSTTCNFSLGTSYGEAEDYTINFMTNSTCNAPVISIQPANAIVCINGTTNFSVSFSAGDNHINYQWQVSTDNGTSWGNISAAGTNPVYSNYSGTITTPFTASLGLTNIIPGNNGLEFKCFASDTTGKCTATSKIVSLSVNQPVSISSITPGETKCEGDKDTLKVAATGNALTYQWFKLEAGSWTLEAGATLSTFTFNNLAVSDSAKYRCHVSNACNSSDTNTFLAVNKLASFNDTIPNQTYCAGQSVTFTADADGTNLSYQWRKGGSVITGETNSTLSFTSLKGSDYSFYSCDVINGCGTKALPSFTLNVNTGPVSNTIYVTQTKSPGDTANYSLSPGGTSPFTFQWLRSGNVIPGATNNAINLLPVACTDSGTYTCKIANGCDSIVAKVAHLYVINCLRNKFAIWGYVKYDNKDTTVMSSNTSNTITTVYLKNSGDVVIDSINTNNAGYYIFVNLINGTYKLTCSTKKPWGGVNPVDALIVNRTYIGIYKLTDPVRRLAADVNKDGKINPVDALMINRRYISILKKFIISDWQFENPTITISGDNVSKNILAICAGDANGSYTPPERVRSYELGVMSNNSININNNEPFDIPIYLNDYAELGALGIKLKIKNEKLKILNVQSDLAGLIYNITDEGVNIAWSAENEGYSITPGKPLFRITVMCSSLQLPVSSFQITSESVLADFDGNYISSDELAIPKIVLRAPCSVLRFSIYPNPFSGITNINYTLPEDANVKINVYNVLGKMVAALVTNEHQQAGQYTVKFDGTNLKQGIYYLRCTMYDVQFSITKTEIMMIAR